MMLHMMNRSHPIYISGERLIQFLKISPSKIVEQVPTTNVLRNNAVKELECAVGDRECLAQCQICEIKSKTSLTNLPKEQELPPLKYEPRNGVVEPSTTTPSSTTLYFSRNNAVTEGSGFGLEPRCGEMKCNPSRGLSRRRGNPKQESLMLNNTATQLNNQRMKIFFQTKIIYSNMSHYGCLFLLLCK